MAETVRKEAIRKYEKSSVFNRIIRSTIDGKTIFSYEYKLVNTMDPIQIARICHEVNRVYCQSIGDTSQVSWEEAPQWQRDSAISGVEAIIKSPNSTPEDTHNNWMKQKEADGWVYGIVKDAELKTHPCLMEYSHLPKEQKVKDDLFIAVVKAFL